MAEPTKYTFTLKEIAKIAAKDAGIKSGTWSIGVNFGINVGNMGLPPDNKARPSTTVSVDQINLVRIPEGEALPDNMEPLVIRLDDEKKPG